MHTVSMGKAKKMSTDPNVTAHSVLDEIMSRDELRSQIMREMGRKGGLAGGPARKAALTPERRSEIAKKAVAERERRRKLKSE
jgi:hypothetical protein